MMKTLPKMAAIANTRSKQRRRKQLEALSEEQKDVLCHCMHWMGKHVPKEHFSRSQRKKIENEKDMIKFLCDLRNCRGSPKEEAKRRKVLAQVGRGFSHFLGQSLPLVTAQVQQLVNQKREH